MISSTPRPRPCPNCCASSRRVATKSCTWCRKSRSQRWQSTTRWSGHGTSTRPATTHGPNRASSRPSASDGKPKEKEVFESSIISLERARSGDKAHCIFREDNQDTASCRLDFYLLRIVQPSRGLGTSCSPRMERLSCIECDWTAEDVVDRVLTLASAGGTGFCGGSGIRAPAATGSSSRGTSIAKLPG